VACAPRGVILKMEHAEESSYASSRSLHSLFLPYIAVYLVVLVQIPAQRRQVADNTLCLHEVASGTWKRTIKQVGLHSKESLSAETALFENFELY
jgi:hypothetical protein